MKFPAKSAVGLAILLWSIQDAIFWRTWFDGRSWNSSAELYQFWHQAFLVGLIVTGLLYFRGAMALWFAGATWTIANSGFPDLLYYWLDLKSVPTTLPWLDQTHPLVLFHPATASNVMQSSADWIAIWIVLAQLYYLVEKSINRDAERVVIGGGL